MVYKDFYFIGFWFCFILTSRFLLVYTLPSNSNNFLEMCMYFSPLIAAAIYFSLTQTHNKKCQSKDYAIMHFTNWNFHFRACFKWE